MSNKKTFWVTWAVCLSISLVAIILLYLGLLDYGITLFCILPVCLGLFTGFLPKSFFAILGMVLAVVSLLLLLWTGELEGIVCILLALPIVAACVFAGYLIGLIIRRFMKQKEKENLKLSLLPLFIFFFALLIHKLWNGEGSENSVTTVMTLNAQPGEVYDHIKNVDTVIAPPHLFHKLGLPYPKKCVMTAEKVGGHRICQFDMGVITETIVELKKDRVLRMAVTDYHLPGGKWFSFKEDRYSIDSSKGHTTISRTTTFTSKLKPRLYWEKMEELTIGAQQQLVFENLKNEIETKR